MAYVERFRLPTDLNQTREACTRALVAADWKEHDSDTLVRKVPSVEYVGPVDSIAGLVIGPAVVAALRKPFGRLLKRVIPAAISVQAPPGPPRVDAELYGIWKQSSVARISLSEVGAFGTDVTISGSEHAGAPSGIRELRRSIEIQSGSLTPYRPPR